MMWNPRVMRHWTPSTPENPERKEFVVLEEVKSGLDDSVPMWSLSSRRSVPRLIQQVRSSAGSSMRQRRPTRRSMRRLVVVMAVPKLSWVSSLRSNPTRARHPSSVVAVLQPTAKERSWASSAPNRLRVMGTMSSQAPRWARVEWFRTRHSNTINRGRRVEDVKDDMACNLTLAKGRRSAMNRRSECRVGRAHCPVFLSQHT